MTKPKTKPSDTPTEETTEPTKAERGRNIQIPAAMFLQCVDALRTTQRDSRRTDRVLHDATRTMVDDALDAIARWQDERVFGRAAT